MIILIIVDFMIATLILIEGIKSKIKNEKLGSCILASLFIINALMIMFK